VAFNFPTIRLPETPTHTFSYFPDLLFFSSLKVYRLPAFPSALCCVSAHSLLTINLYCYYRRKYPVAYVPVASLAEYPQLLERPSGQPPEHTQHFCISSRKIKVPPKFGRSFNNRPHPLQKAKYLFLQLYLGTSHLRNHGTKVVCLPDRGSQGVSK
jgi:hypothetical protein